MSILNTKPKYFPSAIATESGWVNPITKELLVSVGGLKSKIAAEQAEAEKSAPVVEPVKEPVIMETKPVQPAPSRKEPFKKRVVTEAVIPKMENRQIIGEVVEHDVDAKVITE